MMCLTEAMLQIRSLLPMCDSKSQIYSMYVLLTQIAGQQLHVEAGLLLCAAGQELIPLAGKHSLPPLIATSFWSFVAKLFIVHSFWIQIWKIQEKLR